MLQEQLLDYLEVQTAFFDFDNISPVFTAANMALKFGIKRNTASHHLNQLVEEGQVIKINTRPVYFLHRLAFESQFFKVEETVFSSIDGLRELRPSFTRQADIFSLFIGAQGSMARSIEQLKTAVLYPGGGLPFLLTGSSGTGKSYLVRLLHQFAIEQDLIPEDAPFINFNCAQYASNPELLTSNLFGHVQGAFTGATSDKSGAFAAADGGFLFLDEIHRLNPEGQEKLFTYMDTGIIYPMGETKAGRAVKARLAFATTEAIDDVLLTTFLRRIPIRVELPDLEERNQQERLALICSFYIEESRRLDRPLEISAEVVALLKSYRYQGNVGELKNVVKVSAAKAYARSRAGAAVAITLYDLPSQLLGPRQLPETGETAPLKIMQDTVLEQLVLEKNPDQQLIQDTYGSLLKQFEQLRSGALTAQSAEVQMIREIEGLLDQLIFRSDKENRKQLLSFVTDNVREIFARIEASYQVTINGNAVYAIAFYLFKRRAMRWVPDDQEIQQRLGEFLHFVKTKQGELYAFAARILEEIGKKLDLEIFPMDEIILTLYLSALGISRRHQAPRGIIVAHGYSTASSIANVVNRLLGQNIFEAFDMPLDISAEAIAREISLYIERNDVRHGLLIMVDMGSLKEIYRHFDKSLTAPVAIVNNVSTQLALAVGSQLKSAGTLEAIVEAALAQSPTEYELIYPETGKAKAIITTCFTGIGTANQIMKLLTQSIPEALEINVTAYDFETLSRQKNKNAVFDHQEVLAIVGTDDPEIPKIPFISLDDLVSGAGLKRLSEIFGTITDAATILTINDAIVKSFSLERVINSVTILDSAKIIEQVDAFLKHFEYLTGRQIPNDRKVALYIHVSCLIERLVRNAPIQTHGGLAEILQCHGDDLERLREAFTVIEEEYSVVIPESELCYIHDILYKKADTNQKEEEF